MSERNPAAEEQDRILGELARLGLEFAQALTARIATVGSTAEAEALALAFHRATRSARLAIALQQKLARERHEVAKMDRAQAARAASARKEQIRAVLAREILADEPRSEAAEALAERLDERLDGDALFEAFLDGPVEDAIARIREDLGLAAAEAADISASPDAPAHAPWARPAPAAGPPGLALRLAARGPP